jgi:hypothetical protein
VNPEGEAKLCPLWEGLVNSARMTLPSEKIKNSFLFSFYNGLL